MKKGIIQYINSNQLFTPQDNLLVGVSGGIDSVALLDMLINAGYNCSIAHCNFKLRGTESDGDEIFVKSLAEKYKINIHIIHFQTANYAEENNLSIQMAARELRYQWFNDLCNKHNYTHIAIAHHLDDSIETFFINLTRGTGLKGLTGIKPVYNKIVRPLLFAYRKDIEAYINENNLIYREDSSNVNTKYTRNLIRHKIIPLLEEINPSLRATIAKSIEIIDKTEKIYLEKINEIKSIVVSEDTMFTYIDIENLKKLNPIDIYLFEFLRPFQFTYIVIEEIIQALNSVSGKIFYSPTHQLLKDRNQLIISQKNYTDEIKQFYINVDEQKINQPISLKFETTNNSTNFTIPTSPTIACIDFDLLYFPLVLRKWKKGDYFVPLGMKGIKKISDYFIDNKINRYEKENTWLLCSGEKIVWIVGKRIDDKYKITSQTKNIFIIEQL